MTVMMVVILVTGIYTDFGDGIVIVILTCVCVCCGGRSFNGCSGGGCGCGG